MSRSIPDTVRQKVLELAKTDPTGARRYLGQTLNLQKSQRNELFRSITSAAGQQLGHSDRDTEEVTVKSTSLDSLDEVVAHAKVDLAKWDVVDWSVLKTHKTLKQGALSQPVPRFDFRIKLRKKVVDSGVALQQFIATAAAHAPKTFKWTKPGKERDCLYVLNIQDLHLAKLAWAPETGGADWDIRIAEQTYRNAVDDLMGKVTLSRVEEIVVIVGSDMLQVDNDQSTTTAGTYVDSDSRLAKAFEIATKMLTDTIERLATGCKVRAVVVPGNHDSTTSLFLGHYLAAWFRNHTNVTVDSSPRSRKYVGYGKTLIAFDHGDETKLKDLPLVVMRENQETISQYRFTEVLCGHFHSEQSDDMKGVVVRVAPALCSPDRWHSRKGYVGTIRRSQGLLYQRENGLEAIYYSQPLD